ncbi:MAG: response regulator transcription factor [Aggregatilineales bacterium]
MPKVLVVDDELDNVRLLQFVLQRHGFEVVGASNGVEGLTLAQVETPDAIILDMMLPDISGEEFCTRLRRDAATARLPILVLSARSAPAFIDRAIAAGANFYMTKPANFTELVGELRRLIASV